MRIFTLSLANAGLASAAAVNAKAMRRVNFNITISSKRIPNVFTFGISLNFPVHKHWFGFRCAADGRKGLVQTKTTANDLL
jgi:hypothetical protein